MHGWSWLIDAVEGRARVMMQSAAQCLGPSPAVGKGAAADFLVGRTPSARIPMCVCKLTQRNVVQSR